MCTYVDIRKALDPPLRSKCTKQITQANRPPAEEACEGEAGLAAEGGQGAVQPPGQGVAPAAGVVEDVGGAVVVGFVWVDQTKGTAGFVWVRVCVSMTPYQNTYTQSTTYMMSIPFLIASRMKPRRSRSCSFSSSRRNISAIPPTCFLVLLCDCVRWCWVDCDVDGLSWRLLYHDVLALVWTVGLSWRFQSPALPSRTRTYIHPHPSTGI